MLSKIASIVIGGSKTIGSLAWLAPSLLYQRRRAIVIFRTQLQAYGLDEQSVRELTESYRELGNLRSWISH